MFGLCDAHRPQAENIWYGIVSVLLHMSDTEARSAASNVKMRMDHECNLQERST